MNNKKDSLKSIKNTAVICLSPYFGGMEMDAIRIAKLLSSTTVVTLIVKQDAHIANNFNNEGATKNINLVSIKFHYNFSLAIIRQVRELIKRNQISNVIFFGASELRSLYFSFLGLDVNLVIRHGTTKSRPKKDPLHRLIYSNVNYHVAICKHLAKNVEYIIPFGKKTKLQLIYSSLREVPSNIRRREALVNRSVKLLHVGRVTANKGHREAIEACNELYKEGIPFTLTFVGDIDPAYSAVLDSILENKPYRDSIQFVGFTTDVSKFYRESDIFLFPSRGEGLSNAFIESLGYGLVCIAFENTSFPELRDLGFVLFLAKDQDLDSLKRELQDAYTYVKVSGLPVDENIELAGSLFSEKRELMQFIEILK